MRRKNYKYERICIKCGKKFTQKSRNLECSTCRSKKRRNKRKIELVKYKGGKCEFCKFDKYYAALCFHHKDQKEKDFELGDSCRFSFEKLKKEVDKCQLLCANCHQGLHSGELKAVVVERNTRQT